MSALIQTGPENITDICFSIHAYYQKINEVYFAKIINCCFNL